MTPKSLSAIVLRLVGVWLLFEALFGLIGLFVLQQQLAGMPGIHRRWYEGSLPIVTTGPGSYLHDTYYVVSHFSPTLGIMGLEWIAGAALLLWSKPLARLLARNLDDL